MAVGGGHVVIGVLAQPRLEHLGVAPTGTDQLVVVADLDDAAVVHDGDAVGPHGGSQAVGDQDGGAALEEPVERPLDLDFGLEIQVGGCLVSVARSTLSFLTAACPCW